MCVWHVRSVNGQDFACRYSLTDHPNVNIIRHKWYKEYGVLIEDDEKSVKVGKVGRQWIPPLSIIWRNRSEWSRRRRRRRAGRLRLKFQVSISVWWMSWIIILDYYNCKQDQMLVRWGWNEDQDGYERFSAGK